MYPFVGNKERGAASTSGWSESLSPGGALRKQGAKTTTGVHIVGLLQSGRTSRRRRLWVGCKSIGEGGEGYIEDRGRGARRPGGTGAGRACETDGVVSRVVEAVEGVVRFRVAIFFMGDGLTGVAARLFSQPTSDDASHDETLSSRTSICWILRCSIWI